jgi:hypothetical protein
MSLMRTIERFCASIYVSVLEHAREVRLAMVTAADDDSI